MSNSRQPIGSISWIDLTVPGADSLRDFYEKVTGWKSSPVEIGDYQDFCMLPPGSETPVAGICHARGENADLPPQWLMYINVGDLAESVKRCESSGGKIIQGPREIGGGKCAVVQDPAGAYVALYQQADSSE